MIGFPIHGIQLDDFVEIGEALLYFIEVFVGVGPVGVGIEAVGFLNYDQSIFVDGLLVLFLMEEVVSLEEVGVDRVQMVSLAKLISHLFKIKIYLFSVWLI